MSEADLGAHINQDDRCLREPEKALEGVSDHQWTKLHDQRVFRSAKTIEEKWRIVYTIIWPQDTEIPLPCIFLAPQNFQVN